MLRRGFLPLLFISLIVPAAIAQVGIQISPDQVAMLEGESRSFDLLDCKGAQVTGALWDNDGDAIKVKDGERVEVTAVHEGDATLNATVNGVTVSAKVKVFPGNKLPDGTIRWAVPPLKNCDDPTKSNKVVGFVAAAHTGVGAAKACYLIKTGMKRTDVEQMLDERGIAMTGEGSHWRFHEANYTCEIRFTADGTVDSKSIKMDSNTD